MSLGNETEERELDLILSFVVEYNVKASCSEAGLLFSGVWMIKYGLGYSQTTLVMIL